MSADRSGTGLVPGAGKLFWGLVGLVVMMTAYLGWQHTQTRNREVKAGMFLYFLGLDLRNEASEDSLPLVVVNGTPVALAEPSEWKRKVFRGRQPFTNHVSSEGVVHSGTQFGDIEIRFRSDMTTSMTNVIVHLSLPKVGADYELAPYALDDFQRLYLRRTGSPFTYTATSVGLSR